MKKFNLNQKGFSALLLVFMIAFILAAYLLSAQLLSLADSRRVNQVRYSQMAFFAAEGAIYESIQHLRDSPDWPDFDTCLGFDSSEVNGDGQRECHGEYQIGETTINRILVELAENSIRIDVTATIKNTKRRVAADYGHSQTTAQRLPMDIILVIDRSGSMKGTPLAAAIAAAEIFVNIIRDAGLNDQIGLISYSSNAREDSPLTVDYDSVNTEINNLLANGWTNIGEAVKFAREEMEEHGQNETKVIVVLSDGVANENGNNCPIWPCQEPGSNYAPDDLGNECTDYPIREAANTKGDSLNATVYSILLNNIGNSSCSDENGDPYPKSTEDLGRLTLLRVSSEDPLAPLPDDQTSYTYYLETSEEEELIEIFKRIAEEITSPEFIEIREEIPGPGN